MRVTFSSQDAVLLAHAFAGHVASSHSIRVLSIKGPVADRYGLRKDHQAADADVLVEPAQFERFCGELEAAGWHRRIARETPSLIAPHAATYIHDDWPCDLDVHKWYSGFFAEPEVVFELLWRTRESMRIANVDLPVPSRAGAAVIAALHSARHHGSPRHRREAERVESLLSKGFTTQERREFLDLVTAGNATSVLRDLLERAGFHTSLSDITPEQMRLWELNRRYSEESSALGWLLAVRRAPILQRPRLLLRALWVPRNEIPRNLALDLPTRRDAWTYRWHRFRRGWRAIVRFLAERRG